MATTATTSTGAEKPMTLRQLENQLAKAQAREKAQREALGNTAATIKTLRSRIAAAKISGSGTPRAGAKG